MKKISVLFLALTMATGFAWGSLKRGDDGYYHFKNGEKFDAFYSAAADDGSRIGDLFLESGDVYHRIRVYDSRKFPDPTYKQGYQIGITLSNNIRLLGKGFDGLQGDLDETAILFPNGWMISSAKGVATHFSDAEDKFMFNGEVKFGIFVPNIEKYYSAKDAGAKKQAKEFLGELFPGKRIDAADGPTFGLVTPDGHDIDLKTFEWPRGKFYNVNARIKTSAPLHEWPVSIEQTEGMKAGYYGLEKDGLPFGFGSFIHDDGVLTIGEFKDGILEGVAEQLLPDGSSLKGPYVKGYKNGLFTQAVPIFENAQQIARRIDTEDVALKTMSRKERKRARKKARKAELDGTVSEVPVVQILPGKMIWQGQYEQDIQIGWWQKTLGEKIVELRHFDNGVQTEIVSLDQPSKCALNAIDGQMEKFSSSNTSCNGTLFSVKSGTLFTDVFTDGNMIVEATVVPVHPRTFEGHIASGTFTGRQYSANGGVEYIGDMIGGKRNGPGKCDFEGGLEPCEYDVGTRIDLNYLARVEANSLKKWQDDCSSNLSDINNINYSFAETPSSCTVNIFKARFDEAYNRDVSSGVEDDTSYVETLGVTETAQKCIDGEQKGIQSRFSRVSKNTGHLRSHQCMDPKSVSTLASNARQVLEFRKQQLDSFQRYVSEYHSFGKKLQRARKASLRNFRENLNRDTHRDIMASLGSIQTNVDNAMRSSRREYNQIMRTYEVDKPKRYAEYQRSRAVPGRAQGVSVHASGGRPVVQGKGQKVHRVDELLAAYKKKCLSDPANSWKNNGCVYTIPYDGRFNCSDLTGQTCKTGERWNPNNTAPKQLTATHSGATSFGTSGSGSSGSSSGGGSGLASTTGTSGTSSSSGGNAAPVCENVTNKCMSFISETTSGDYLKINVVNRCGHAVGYQLCYQSSSKGASCIGNSNLGAQGNFTHENYSKKAGDGRYHYVAWKKPAPAGCTPKSLDANLRKF